jgi:hypothetical protein
MDSSEKNNEDSCDRNINENKERSQDIAYDPKEDEWDEWYDIGEIQNKKSKIRRSKKRLYKQRDEW